MYLHCLLVPAARSRSASSPSFGPMSASASPSTHGSRVVQALPDVLDGLQLVKPRPSRVPTLAHAWPIGARQAAALHYRDLGEHRFLQALTSRRHACHNHLRSVQLAGERSSISCHPRPPHDMAWHGQYPRMAAGELQFGLVWPSRHRHQQCLTAVSALAS